MSSTGLVRLRWDRSQRVQAVEGDAQAVAGRAEADLIGQSLAEVLRVTPEEVKPLNALAERPGGGTCFLTRMENNRRHYIRALVSTEDDSYAGAFLDLDTVLDGAPPVQISRLSSSLSHEIRNPLSSVKMAVQTLARNQELGERDKRRLAIANREIRTMERMLWLLSEYGRDSAPEITELPLRTVVQDAAAMVEPELNERNVQLQILEEEENLRVRVDAQRLRPVLSQILLNVAMGLPSGGPLQVRLRKAGGGVSMVVTDEASAMPADEALTLFEPFGSRLARGAGLSLAALRRVVRAAGGEVTAHGSESPGTVFTVTLPG
ncbi:MAG: sensor histidine kinase [Myxococcaceae bacterium]